MSDKNQNGKDSVKQIQRRDRKGHPRIDGRIPDERKPLVIITCHYPQETIDFINKLTRRGEFVNFSEALRYIAQRYKDERDLTEHLIRKKIEENNHE